MSSGSPLRSRRRPPPSGWLGKTSSAGGRNGGGGQTGPPAPASVRWRWGPDTLTLSPGEAVLAPPPGTGPAPFPGLDRPGEILSSGVVTRLHDEVYARLPYGRLVLTRGTVS